jgi:hypothetical protein
MLQSIAIFKNEIFWVPSSQANAILNLSDSTVKKNELGCKLVQSRLPDPALSCHSQGSALFFHFYFFVFITISMLLPQNIWHFYWQLGGPNDLCQQKSLKKEKLLKSPQLFLDRAVTTTIWIAPRHN